MAVDQRVMKALKIVTDHAMRAEGSRSFGKSVPDRSTVISDQFDGEDQNKDPSETPGSELNSRVQNDVLGHQDHQLPEDGWMAGSLVGPDSPQEHEPDAEDPFEDTEGEMEMKPKKHNMGFMSTNMARSREPSGIAETAKRRRGRPRGSKY